jgi:UDP-glucose 4-epimerase
LKRNALILLIGGDGFLGRHLTDLLNVHGYEVTVVTRSPDVTGGYSGARRLVLASTLASESDFQRLIGRATVVFYLASVSVPSTFVDEPWLEIGANVTPAVEFFARCARANPTIRIVLVSSGGTIYGHSGDARVDEEAPTSPMSAYGLGKLMIETGLSFIGRTYGLSHRTLRVSNPVGKWQSSRVQGVVPAILRSVRLGQPFRVFGDGKQIRDYVDADEVAAALLAGMEDRANNDRIWNVGSGIGHSVLDVVRAVEAVVQKAVDIEFYPARKSDIRSIVLDCSRIERELGWRSKTSLERSIEKIVAPGSMF